MSRSVHTRPRRIRSADRLRQPRKPRGADDLSRIRSARRELKALGLPAVEAARAPSATWSLPTLVETRPRTGYHHPAGKAELAEILRFFGEEYVYGLRAVELRQADPGQTGLQLGRLVVPGQIVLYEQRPSPWHLPGHLGEDEARQLQAAGALLEPLEASTLVEWPGDTLRDFMRIDVLMHEVGHHLLQQHKGKRLARVARTRDHEAFADTLARRCRAIYQAHREQTE